MPSTSELFEVQNFLRSLRESGYKSTAWALAELIDNSIEANAKFVSIHVLPAVEGRMPRIVVVDDGHGMDQKQLSSCLKLGGSSRFDSRIGMGRFGVGLPGASLSQCRRVEVYSWSASGEVLATHLDLGEDNQVEFRPCYRPDALAVFGEVPLPSVGTAVVWTNCDRLMRSNIDALVALLSHELGRIFRYAIWNGVGILVNGELVKPLDPMFLQGDDFHQLAKPYGDMVVIPIDAPLFSDGRREATIRVRWSELPIEEWFDKPSRWKRSMGIIGVPQVSILRGGREVDRGWFFLGDKARQNYDAWWRAEIDFSPELDELFGICNNKQSVNPTPALVSILTPHIETTAKALYGRVQQRYASIRRCAERPKVLVRAEQKDAKIPPARGTKNRPIPTNSVSKGRLSYRYRIAYKSLSSRQLFEVRHNSTDFSITLNSDHPAVARIRPLLQSSEHSQDENFEICCLLLIALARTELLSPANEKALVRKHHERFSDVLASYLE